MASDPESQPQSRWPSERWDRIDELLQSALEMKPDQRAAYLREACAGDAPLLREVESLLSSHEQAGSFIERPALDVTPKRFAAEGAGVLVGRRIGPYELLSLLGSGGMGEVYRATDTRLDRTVAIKFLPAHLSSNPELRHRFEREARAVSSLNHPHICTLYDVGRHGDVDYLVMEYLEGKTLADRLSKGALPLEQVLQYGIQLAAALSAAHRQGVTHRDIKPGNIMLVKSGTKLLDFGLAKLSRPAASGPSTLSSAAPLAVNDSRTAEGTILGTIQYMAPEQLEGEDAGARTDIFAFGAVLYEMATGRKAFEGKSHASLIAAIMTFAPPRMTTLQPLVPDALDHLVRRCLAKDPEERWQSAYDLKSQLEWIAEGVSKAETVALSSKHSLRTTRRRFLWGLLLGGPIGAALKWYLDRSGYWWMAALADARFEYITNSPGTELDAVISPDGELLAFLSDRAGQFDVWAGQIRGTRFNNLTNGQVPDVRNPEVRSLGFFPDDRNIWFWCRYMEKPAVWTVPFLGGTAVHYSFGIEPDWSPDGRMVYHPAAAGDPLSVTQPDERDGREIYSAREATKHCHFPVWSPDGAYIYFVQGYPPNEMDIWRIRPDGKSAAERITSYNTLISHLTFLDQRTLLYIALDRNSSGPWLYGMDVEDRMPYRLIKGLERYKSIAAAPVARRLVATEANPVANLWQVAIPEDTEDMVDDSAVVQEEIHTVRGLSPRLGPDCILYLSSNGGIDGILKRLANGTTLELWKGSQGRVSAGPAISGDGRIALVAQKEGRTRLYVIREDIDPHELPLKNPDGNGLLDARGAPAWSPDMRSIIVGAGLDANPASRPHLYRIPVDGGPLEQLTPKESMNPVWSPDGRYLVYSAGAASIDFPLGAITPQGEDYSIPHLGLTRGSSRFVFLPGSQFLVVLKGGLLHKNFYTVDLTTGRQRQLTKFSSEFLISDFDISADGKRIVFDRLRENSKVVLIDLPKH